MTLIRSIVVATDFSPGASLAVDRAVDLARAHRAVLHVLHAFDISAWHSLTGVFDAQRFGIDPPPDVRTRQRLTDLAQSLATQTGLEVNAQFSVGASGHAIGAYAKAHTSSLIVIGSRAEPSMLGLGSTAWKAVRAPTSPVLIVRSPARRPYARVLVAVDLREGALRAAAMAAALFPDTRLHLLYAVDPALDAALSVGGFASEQVRMLREAMHKHAVVELHKMAGQLAAQVRQPIETEVVDDMPSRAIVARAAALPADCVVVGHHGQGAMTDAFLGNMAQHLIHHAGRDLLVVP